MSQIGTVVTTAETPPPLTNIYNSATAFMTGFGDWGPANAAGARTPMTSLAQVASYIGSPSGAGVTG